MERTYTKYHILEHNGISVAQKYREICDKSLNPLPGSVEISQYDHSVRRSYFGKKFVRCLLCGNDKPQYNIEIWTYRFNETYDAGNFCADCLKILQQALQKVEDNEWKKRKEIKDEV